MGNDAWAQVPDETPIDPSGLTAKARRHVTDRRSLNLVEAENIRKVVIKYLATKPNEQLAPFDFTWMLQLHGEMFCDVWQWAGQTRQVEVNIGARVFNIHGELFDLLQNLDIWKSGTLCPLEQASRLHHGAVKIHPFLNGNGRWARMLANVWLRKHDHPMIQWPETTIGEASTIREKYIAAIQLADRGEFEGLIKLHERYAQKYPDP